MRTVKITYENGQEEITNINGTNEDIEKYYLNNPYGGFEMDEMKPPVKAVKVEFLV